MQIGGADEAAISSSGDGAPLWVAFPAALAAGLVTAALASVLQRSGRAADPVAPQAG